MLALAHRCIGGEAEVSGEAQLRDKLRKTEALFAGEGTAGERARVSFGSRRGPPKPGKRSGEAHAALTGCAIRTPTASVRGVARANPLAWIFRAHEQEALTRSRLVIQASRRLLEATEPWPPGLGHPSPAAPHEPHQAIAATTRAPLSQAHATER